MLLFTHYCSLKIHTCSIYSAIIRIFANPSDSFRMNMKYNIAVNTVNAALKLYAHCLPSHVNHKFPEFVKGRIALVRRIAAEMRQDTSGRPVVWFHASSLGEYAIARPLISAIKADGEATVVLTFFSPSGYRALRDNHPGIDHLFYLPLDTRPNVRGFIEAVRPTVAVFLVSEYWPNMLEELKFHNVPTYLVSAIIRNNSVFFRWYGKLFRKALSCYTRFFVLDHNSLFNLKMLGYDNVTLSGDPLFDNASLVAHTPWSSPVLDRFCQDGAPVLMAGSVSDRNDLKLVAATVNSHPKLKAIIVPHDVSAKAIAAIRKSLDCDSELYSALEAGNGNCNARVIIVDSVGKLAYMYRYATMAYVGGGFTPLLHSVIEGTVYGLPVSFGPRIERKVTPQQLMELGIGAKVKSAQQLSEWVDSLMPTRLAEIHEKAREYVRHNLGATVDIVKTIEGSLWPKK